MSLLDSGKPSLYSGRRGETDGLFQLHGMRGLGDNIARYQRKGSKVAVSGSIQLRNYEDNQGVKRTAVDIICQDVEFLSAKGAGSDDSGYVPDVSPVQTERKRPVLQAFDDDEDTPF